MPDRASIYRWLDSNELFRNQYARARTEQAEYYASEIVEIADEHPTCTITLENGGIRESVDGAGVQRNRLRVDARKWIACKLLPKVYGEKLMHSGPDGEGPAVFVLERIGSKEADSSTK